MKMSKENITMVEEEYPKTLNSASNYYMSFDDIVYNPARAKYFLQFLSQENISIGISINFLADVKSFSCLNPLDVPPGELSKQAKNIVTKYFKENSSLQPYLDNCDNVIHRIQRMVDHLVPTLDMFSGVAAHVQQQLERTCFTNFIISDSYQSLCDSMIQQNDISLSALLSTQEYYSFLETFIRTYYPDEIGNLLFWIDVQSSYVPLLEISSTSSAGLGHIHHVMSRIYHHYLEEKCIFGANILNANIKSNIITQMWKIQKTEFILDKYLELFQPAQDCIFQWLKAKIYSEFKQSSYYLQMIVKIKRTEEEKRFMDAREQLKALFNEHIESKLVKYITIEEYREISNVEHIKWDIEHSEMYWEAFIDKDRMPKGIEAIASYQLVPKVSCDSLKSKYIDINERKYTNQAHFYYGLKSLPCHFMEFCHSKPTVSSHAHSPRRMMRQLLTPPNDSIHNFILPRECGSLDEKTMRSQLIYGCCLTRWTVHDVKHEFEEEEIIIFVPHFICILSSDKLIYSLRKFLIEFGKIFPVATHAKQQDVQDNIKKFTFSMYSTTSYKSETPILERFCLENILCPIDFEVNILFQFLSIQNVTRVIMLLLLENKLVLISRKKTLLVLAAEIFMELIQPFQWTQGYEYLPYCPTELVDGLYSTSESPSVILGVEGLMIFSEKIESKAFKHIPLEFSLWETPNHLMTVTPLNGSQPFSTKVFRDKVVVDLDHDMVYVPKKIKSPSIDSMYIEKLEKKIKIIMFPSLHQCDSMVKRTDLGPKRDQEKKAQVEIAIRLAFREFLCTLLGNIPEYFATLYNVPDCLDKNVSKKSNDQYGVIMFDKVKFYQLKKESKDFDFFDIFFDGQMFRDYVNRYHDLFFINENHD